VARPDATAAAGNGNHRPEQSGLIGQHGQVCVRLTAISKHHRQIDGDPARIMTRTPPPQRCQRVAESAGVSWLFRTPEILLRSSLSSLNQYGFGRAFRVLSLIL